MEEIKFMAFAFILFGFQLYTLQCQNCEVKLNASGKILSDGNFSTKQICWKISVPRGHFIDLKFNSLQSKSSCDRDHVRIKNAETSDVYQFCSSNYTNKPIPKIFGNVTVIYFISHLDTFSSLELEYAVKSRVLTINGVPKAIENAVSWLKQKRTAAWGWRENTPRAVVALYLASAASFDGTNLEEELMAKQLELKTAVALQRPFLTKSELGMFINALLVTCHSPRHFYGNNLVKRLKEQIESSENFTHPLAYLALCNANESWPRYATMNLNSILRSNSEYPFVKDLQAMAVTALSCKVNRNRNSDSELENTTLTLYRNTIEHFKKLQAQDGSFGNVYTTALIYQALFSSGEHLRDDFNLNTTIKYLIKELKSSSVNFLATYLVLPILNGKSLMDISYINCSANPRKHGDDPLLEMNEYLGPKMRVQYSLFIGDEKDVIHTISLRVPENYTAAKVMELAKVENPKYKFEWKTTSGKMYVYEIANVTNDPEAGKFWLLFVGATNRSDPLVHLKKGPDEVILHDGQHLILWYKTATI